MAENLAIDDFALQASDMAQIAALEIHTSCFFFHRDSKIVKCK